MYLILLYSVLCSDSSTQQSPLQKFQVMTKVGGGQELSIFARTTVCSEAALQLTDKFLFCSLCVRIAICIGIMPW